MIKYIQKYLRERKIRTLKTTMEGLVKQEAIDFRDMIKCCREFKTLYPEYQYSDSLFGVTYHPSGYLTYHDFEEEYGRYARAVANNAIESLDVLSRNIRIVKPHRLDEWFVLPQGKGKVLYYPTGIYKLFIDPKLDAFLAGLELLDADQCMRYLSVISREIVALINTLVIVGDNS